jgi:hypothetical protein
MTTAPMSNSPTGSRLTPTFRIELRRRHDEAAPVEVVEIQARTIASARHAARLAHPDTVILSVIRL